MEKKEMLVYIDGEFYPKSQAKISVFDHGLLYGDGVFEGIRAYFGSVFRLREHIDRLYRSAHTLLLDIPMTKERLIHAVLKTLAHNNLENAYIRLIVTRGIGDLGLDPRKCPKPTIIIITDSIKLVNADAIEKGITATISWVRRDAVDGTSHEIKSLNYLNSVLAKIEAIRANTDEAIYLDKNGFVVEGVAENIFMVKSRKIITPPDCCGALPGITQAEIKRIANEFELLVEEKNITPHDLFNADEVFFTGTAAEIIPVREINGRTIGDGKPGPITKTLLESFKKAISDPNNGIPIRDYQVLY